MQVDLGTVVLAAGAVVFVVGLVAAMLTVRGRQKLADVGIAFAWALLRLAERRAERDGDWTRKTKDSGQ